MSNINYLASFNYGFAMAGLLVILIGLVVIYDRRIRLKKNEQRNFNKYDRFVGCCHGSFHSDLYSFQTKIELGMV